MPPPHGRFPTRAPPAWQRTTDVGERSVRAHLPRCQRRTIPHRSKARATPPRPIDRRRLTIHPQPAHGTAALRIRLRRRLTKPLDLTSLLREGSLGTRPTTRRPDPPAGRHRAVSGVSGAAPPAGGVGGLAPDENPYTSASRASSNNRARKGKLPDDPPTRSVVPFPSCLPTSARSKP